MCRLAACWAGLALAYAVGGDVGKAHYIARAFFMASHALPKDSYVGSLHHVWSLHELRLQIVCAPLQQQGSLWLSSGALVRRAGERYRDGHDQRA